MSDRHPRVDAVTDARSFVHLHNHTEYSMLDGAAKVGPLFAEAKRLGMTAIGMTDHGNMFGASEFYNVAVRNEIKPIIGIEAYIAPESRFSTKRVQWGTRDQRSDDVSGSGSYTHMSMVAANATGLRNLFRLDHLAARMRRYNDNLLVLAGSAVRTRSSAPVAIADVFRAATSEMEQYERVRLQPLSGAAIY